MKTPSFDELTDILNPPLESAVGLTRHNDKVCLTIAHGPIDRSEVIPRFWIEMTPDKARDLVNAILDMIDEIEL